MSFPVHYNHRLDSMLSAEIQKGSKPPCKPSRRVFQRYELNSRGQARCESPPYRCPSMPIVPINLCAYVGRAA